MGLRVGINGYGRIGRRVLRHVVAGDHLDVVAINSRQLTPELAARLLKYDSVHGRFPGQIEVVGGRLVLEGLEMFVGDEARPEDCHWGELGVDIVIEASGMFTSRDRSEGHLRAGALKVVVTAPAEGADATIVVGVNDGDYRPDSHHVVSASSCTTNCLAPLLSVLDSNFGVTAGVMTTIHAYTRDQELLDGTHTDPRRARAATLNMVPTTTGSAKAIGMVLPQLRGRVVGLSVRVPLPDVSLVDLSVNLDRRTSADEANAAFIEAAANGMRGILDVTDEPLVSSDFHGDEHSAIIDLPSTREAPDGMLKVLAWYDNEAAYAARVVDLVKIVAAGAGSVSQQPAASVSGIRGC
jgi:glyceraldehyde 3-phosphate dehydrogenase